jgi:tripartite-type tricarboxylate transporter receptor subunit TctC
MELARRTFGYLALVAAVLPLVPRIASGQIYPTRPVRLICAFPAGGPNDTLARLIGQWLSERLGRPFVVENRPGAATNIATEAVVRAPPDGYTLLLIAQVNAINVTLYERLNFNFIRDIAAVAGIMRVPSIMEVNPSVPVHTVPEFIAYAKANPGRLNMASAGNETSSHLSGELFKIMAGVDVLHVPYRGAAAALTDLIAARVQVYFDLMPSSIAHVRSGKVRPLAITSATRSGTLPDLPSLGDFVPGYEVNTWFGVGAPRGTPADIVDKLNEEINAALADPQMKARLAELGGTVLAGTPADFGKLIADETDKWGKVIRAANIKPE